MWPPQSPGAIPLDYSIWSIVQGKAQVTSHHNKEELKAPIIKVWDKMDLSYVIKSCKGFWGYLEDVIEANRGLIEKSEVTTIFATFFV